MKKTPLSRIAFSLLALSLVALSACERDTTYDELAACIADSGAVFYGAYWCPNCQYQEELFGDSADLLPYVECDAKGKDAQPELCAEKGIKSYPTWIFADGTVLTGWKELETLSDLTKCPLPGEQKSVMFE